MFKSSLLLKSKLQRIHTFLNFFKILSKTQKVFWAAVLYIYLRP